MKGKIEIPDRLGIIQVTGLALVLFHGELLSLWPYSILTRLWPW